MTTLPTAGPLEHPSWCDRQHAQEWTAHTVEVGAPLELARGLTYQVVLFQQGDEPTQVHLFRHSDDETALVSLSLLEAGILRDLLAEGLQLVAGA